MILFIAIIFTILLVLGVPIAFVLGLTTLFSFIKMGNPIIFKLLPQRMFDGTHTFVLMAIPFFILAGEIMTKSQITRGMVHFSNTLVGHLRGGLGHVNIVASMLFAGITGSAVSDTAAIGSVLIPAMTEEGYDIDFSTAVTAASSVIGPIIPPSIPMIIYASIMEVSVAGLFLAGFLPGILIGFGLMSVVWLISRKRNYPLSHARAPFLEMLKAFRHAIISLLMPVIILGGIFSGAFTPTEASAIAVGYGLIVGFFVMKTLKLRDLPEIMRNTLITTSIILFIIATATAFGWIMAFEEIPQKIAKLILSISPNIYVNLFLFNLLFFISGMFMDLTVSILVLGPILAPAAIQMGIHPLHFAIIMCVNLTVGLATPPVGLILFVACSLTGMSLERLSKAIWPFLVAEILVVLLVTYVGAIPMIFPKLFGYYY